MSNRHRAEVIEVYPAEGKAAVRFSWRGRDRIECVNMYVGPDAYALEVGMRGCAVYAMDGREGKWGFEPSKSAALGNEAARMARALADDAAIERIRSAGQE